MGPSIELARLPTPIHPIQRLRICPNTALWIKRDDLTGAGLTGNKVRKLEFLLADAQAQGATAVMTCGGIQSNHARATAIAARQMGLRPYLLLRGAPPEEVQGNLLLDALVGAEIQWTTPQGYAERDGIMRSWARSLSAHRRERVYIIPEGGSNAVGSQGYLRAGMEIAEQSTAMGVQFDTVVFACGSGGTAAGLLAAHLIEPTRVPRPVAVPVCDDSTFFRPRVRAIASELLRTRASRGTMLGALQWLDGYVGLGYALSRKVELDAISDMARQEGLLLDPTYTGKAWLALTDTVHRSPGALGKNVLFLHSGGLPSLFAKPGTLESPLEPDEPHK